METEEPKQLMTVLGPKIAEPEDVFLPYEHLTSDLSGINIGKGLKEIKVV